MHACVCGMEEKMRMKEAWSVFLDQDIKGEVVKDLAKCSTLRSP